MEFGAATLAKKHSNYGVSGKSAYDGVFATPVKLRAPSCSYRFDDYCEVFGSSGDSVGSSIPKLELPELKERRMVDDVRRSKIEYSTVFGGFGNLDAAVPFEEVAAKPKAKDRSSARSNVKSGEQSRREDHTASKEIPLVSPSSNDTKRINMSYHKVNQGSESGTHGTTHIAKLHAVPAYTCVIEEVNSVKLSRAEKTTPAAQDTYSGSRCFKGIKEGGCRTKSFSDPSPDIPKKPSSNNGVKSKNRSASIDLFSDACKVSSGGNGDHQIKEVGRPNESFTDPSPDNAKKQSSTIGMKAKSISDSVDTCEISNGSNGTDQVNVPPSETKSGNLGSHNVNAMGSMPTKWQASKTDTYEGAADFPTYSNDMVDSNSAVAASVAALRKAIEEAQVRMKVAKESMRRKKEGFPDRVKRKSNIGLKAGVKNEAKHACETMKPEEIINTRQTFGEMDALPQVSSEVGKPMMGTERVRLDLGDKDTCVVKEALQEAPMKMKSSQAELKEEVELKEAGHKGKGLEPKDTENTKKVLYNENTGRSALEEPEESDHTTELVNEYSERENGEGKVHAGNVSGACEELVHEIEHKCQGAVDEKLIQKTLDNGTIDERLKVDENGEVENKVTPFNEPKDYEINLSGKGLMKGNIEKVGCKLEEGKKVEAIELKECQYLEKGEKNISQEQKGSEDTVEVFSELEEWELTDLMEEPMGNEGVCNPHYPEITSMEKEIDNVGHLEELEGSNESGFLDMNQETECSCLRDAIDNTFSNIHVQEIPEDIVVRIHVDEEIYKRNGKVEDVLANENKLEGAKQLMEENERERKDNKAPEVIIESQNDRNYEEVKAKESDNTTEPSVSYELDETENLSNNQVGCTIIENDENIEETPEVYSYDVQDMLLTSNSSIQLQEKCKEPESVQDTNDFCKKHAGETSAFYQGDPELDETVNQMKNTFEAVASEDAATSIGAIDIKVTLNQDQSLAKAESDRDPMFVEETTPEFVEKCKDAKEESGIVSDEETDANLSNSSSEEILFGNELNIEASQTPSMSEWKSSPFKEEEVKLTHSSSKNSLHASVTMEEKEVSGKPQQVELDREHLKKIDEAKERKREREKEKLAVERAIREARERAFADARERAALERAAAEARQKSTSDGRERLGRSTRQENGKTPAEKASMEAKLKAERAAVERATSEARARALERALSEKAASDARKKSDKSAAEKGLGTSRDNGMKQNFSKSFSYGEARDSTDAFDGANGDSAQRCKARSERHQRIGERVAKALAEKNMRDWLVQKEQEEKNRLAEALDADVKRWSSGKAGNLRALLSTLQYILGPDSGWQPIPLTEIVTATAVKKAYRKATLFVHPDKLQQRRASIKQKYTCEKVFDLLKDAWNRFNMEER